MSTASRRRTIRLLLKEHPIASQAHLLEVLERRGFRVTQATVSRDLQALGARKEGERYVLTGPPDHEAAENALASVIDGFVGSIEPAGNIVVLKTPPGAAQVVAAALDAARLDGVAGSVAGDDTVLVVVGQGSTGRRLARQLEELGASL